MSMARGRKFRVISDSEEEPDEVKQRTVTTSGDESNSAPHVTDALTNIRTDDNEDDAGQGFTNFADKQNRKRRARFASDDESGSESNSDGINLISGIQTDKSESFRFVRDNAESESFDFVQLPYGTRRQDGSQHTTVLSEGNAVLKNKTRHKAQRESGHEETSSDNDSSGSEHSDDDNDGDGNELVQVTENEAPNGVQDNNEGLHDEHEEQDERVTGGPDEAEEAPARKVVKKRIVKNPQPKLNEERLTGERGLRRLRSLQRFINLKGKDHEHEDVRCILHNLQLWGHRMFPKMQMKDVFERCERLGQKMAVKVYLRRMRNGEISEFDLLRNSSDNDDVGLTGTSAVDEVIESNESHQDPHTVADRGTISDGHYSDLFETLLKESHESSRAELESLNERHSQASGQCSTAQADVEIQPEISEEVRLQIEARRQAALQRRLELQRERAERESHYYDEIPEMEEEEQFQRMESQVS